MERLIQKIENMTLEEFNAMMGRFIDRTKKMIGIGKLMETIKDKVVNNYEEPWNGFFNAKLFNDGKPTKFHINNEWLSLKFDDKNENEGEDGTVL